METQPTNLEIREIQTTLEIREAPNKIYGYACFWNTPSVVQEKTGKVFKEQFAKGCFEYDDVRGLISHDPVQLTCHRGSGMLIVNQDDKGLQFEMVMPDTKLGHETLQKTRANFYKGASVGFRVLQDKWDFTGKPSVTIQKAYLSEISLTNHPAHVTTLSLREIPMPDFTKQKIRLYRLMLPIL